MFTSTVYVTLNYFRFSERNSTGEEEKTLGKQQTFEIDPGHGSKKARGQFRTKSPEEGEKRMPAKISKPDEAIFFRKFNLTDAEHEDLVTLFHGRLHLPFECRLVRFFLP